MAKKDKDNETNARAKASENTFTTMSRGWNKGGGSVEDINEVVKHVAVDKKNKKD